MSIIRPAIAPRIVLVGEKNAGKSSVIGRLCGVNTGGPTFGAIEWHISEGPMAAQVYIAWSSRLSDPAPMIPFGHLLHDQSSLESMVLRAQIAAFLGEDEANDFLAYTDALIHDLHVSLAELHIYTPHVVHVVYQNPDIPLKATFVDLPGLLRNGPDEAIRAAAELTLANIEPPKSVVVVVMTLASHGSWNAAQALVNEIDPSGYRTIGLFTKPFAIAGWEALERDWMIKDYFCIHDPKERHERTSLPDSRLREAAFFRENMPWSTFSHRHTLGIDAFLIEARYISDCLHYGVCVCTMEEPHVTPLAPFELEFLVFLAALFIIRYTVFLMISLSILLMRLI